MKNKKTIKSNKKRKTKKYAIPYNPSPYLRKVIAESEKEYAEGKCKSYKGVEELMKALHSQN